MPREINNVTLAKRRSKKFRKIARANDFEDEIAAKSSKWNIQTGNSRRAKISGVLKGRDMKIKNVRKKKRRVTVTRDDTSEPSLLSTSVLLFFQLIFSVPIV